MTRLTREQSQRITRERLLQAAGDVVARDGYEGASVDRIAEAAGYSKGAFYSNFASKEDVLDQVLQGHTSTDAAELTALLRDVDDPHRVIDLIAAWSDSRAAEMKWGLLAIEFLRRARREGTIGDHHRDPFVLQWRTVGTLLVEKLFPGLDVTIDPLNLGGTLLELTYGGVAPFIEANSSGQMTRDVLRAFVLAYTPNDPLPDSEQGDADRGVGT